MPKKKSYITVTDVFCGAGGSSQGAKKVVERVGGEITLALNHWKLAIETHNTNFPDTQHDCTDVSACDPRRYPSTTIAIMSPECTTHSPAGGNNHKTLKKQMDMFTSGEIDPATERSRATMWDVCRFAEYHQYETIIVENVVEAKTRWVLFENWLSAMHTLGYNHKCVYLNSMHCHPTPQSRDRMYVVFWKKGNRTPSLDYTPKAHCPKCGKDVSSIQTWKQRGKEFGKYRQQYVYCCPFDGAVVEPYYFASFNCIDWSDIGQRIGDRKKPLAPNSTKRIQYGIDKYDVNHLLVGNYSPGWTKPVTESLGTVTCQDHHALFSTPFIIKGEHSLNDPMVRSIYESLMTQVTRQTMSLVTPPFLTELYGTGKVRTASEEINTITSQGVKTGIVTTESWNCFIANYYGGSDCTKHYTQEFGSFTTSDRSGLAIYKKPNIDDCYYRMLKPHEVQLGMAFDSSYKVLGNSKEKVKQLGNAVTPPAMEWLVQQCVDSLN